MQYFERTYQTASKNFADYSNNTNGQRTHLAFCAAGNLSKASNNRLQNIRNVSYEKHNKVAIRKLMLDLYKLIIEPEMCKKYHWTYLSKWKGIDSIIEQMKMAAYWGDDTDYWQAILSTSCQTKLDVMIAFINRYGSSTDKKTFLPLLKLN